MTSETKEKILKLNGVTDPGALADVLFQAQHPDLAVVFYGRAIKGATTPETKAWLLFQTANCSNETDPKAAVKTYDQLVASHPKSLWSNIAKLQKGMVQWRTTNNMMLLLNDIEQQGQPASNVSEQK